MKPMDVFKNNDQTDGADDDDGDQTNDILSPQREDPQKQNNNTYQSPKAVCNFSTHSFAEVVNTSAFVDKTLFIKEFLECDDSFIAIVAPRKFCKSTNMDMVKEFLSGNKKIFEDHKLAICEKEKDFFKEKCKYSPVIHIDFRNIGGTTFKTIFKSLKVVICQAYADHKCLVKQNKEEKWVWSKDNTDFNVDMFIKCWLSHSTLLEIDVLMGFRWLSKFLRAHYDSNVYVLIDEYDAPIMKAILKPNTKNDDLKNTLTLISTMMSNFLNDNKFVERALINACVRIEDVFGSGNNIIYYPFLEKQFSPYFGFTADEVEELFTREEFKDFRDDDQIQEWYGGYQILDDTDKSAYIYNNYSILKYLKRSQKMNKKMIGSYWVDSENITDMKELFSKHTIRKYIEDLVNGKEVKIKTHQKLSTNNLLVLKSLFNVKFHEPVDKEAQIFLQFLSNNGYVTGCTESSTEKTLKVPNVEIKKALKENCDIINKSYPIDRDRVETYVEALQSMLEENDKNAFIGFAKAVANLFLGPKTRMPRNEAELHSVLFTFAYNTENLITLSEVNVQTDSPQKGRPPRLDMLVTLGCNALILEIKYDNNTAQKALHQIGSYQKILGDYAYHHISNKICMGLHLNINKKVSLWYKVNDSESSSVDSNCDFVQPKQA